MVVCHLDFSSLKILTAEWVQGSHMRNRAKFRQDRSTLYGDIAIY